MFLTYNIFVYVAYFYNLGYSVIKQYICVTFSNTRKRLSNDLFDSRGQLIMMRNILSSWSHFSRFKYFRNLFFNETLYISVYQLLKTGDKFSVISAVHPVYTA